jgi:hypothetical protein
MPITFGDRCLHIFHINYLLVFDADILVLEVPLNAEERPIGHQVVSLVENGAT